MNLTLISSAVAALAGFGLAWQLQAGNIASIQLEQANDRIALQRGARAALERHMQSVGQAQDAAANRLRTIAAERDGLTTALNGLSAQSAVALRAAGESLDACNATAATFSELLNQCSGRYSKLATEADGHVNDKQTLIQAWPK